MYKLSIDNELGRDIDRHIHDHAHKRDAAMVESWDKLVKFYLTDPYRIINCDYEFSQQKRYTVYDGSYEIQLVGPNTISVAEYNSDNFDYVVSRYAQKLSDLIGV